MASSYRQIALDEALPGMILSDDLLDSQGKILLPQGIILTETTLASLRRHDIEMIPILCEAISEAEQEAELASRKQRLDALFRKSSNDTDGASSILEGHVRYFRLGDEA